MTNTNGAQVPLHGAPLTRSIPSHPHPAGHGYRRRRRRRRSLTEESRTRGEAGSFRRATQGTFQAVAVTPSGRPGSQALHTSFFFWFLPGTLRAPRHCRPPTPLYAAELSSKEGGARHDLPFCTYARLVPTTPTRHRLDSPSSAALPPPQFHTTLACRFPPIPIRPANKPNTGRAASH